MLLIILFLLNIFCKQSAVILILCRNSDIDGIISSIKSLKSKFNDKFNYPYVFLNDVPFDESFKERINELTDFNSKFGTIKKEDWDMPISIDKEKAKKNWLKMKMSGVPYSDLESYHNMCRFYSRSFYKNDLLKDYEYFWRVEPNVKFHCTLDYDVFDFMKNNNKKYGFNIILHEFKQSIETLMKTTSEFLLKNHDKIINKNNLNFLYENGKYNLCHFWSNFTIASFDFFRSKIYNDYVDFLENSGGFYYERWGDAPVHSIAASLFLNKNEIHFFDDIGYTHDIYTHCPLKNKNCDCDPNKSVDFLPESCYTKFINEII